MEISIIERTISEAKYMINTGKTVRQIALVFGVSKSTVHKDLKDRLKYLDKDLYLRTKRIMKYHLNVRHIRGGESTKKKYKKLVNKM
ncbi:MAG: sporulation transcriptional regulator SpoIIID [Bacilli bacterium]|nr:sporulation transcriptional regulator SpoIIID [Bacilli bacterium]